jgi:hypothetical protein
MKVGLIIGVAFFAGCAAQPQAVSPSNPEPAAQATRTFSRYWDYAIVHSFGKGAGGKKPQSGVLAYGGRFYGTLSRGGGTRANPGFNLGFVGARAA